MRKFIKYAEKRGAEYVELKETSSEKTAVEIQNRDIRNLSESSAELRAARVVYKGSEGLAFSSTSDYKSLIDRAIKLSKITRQGIRLAPQDRARMKLKSRYKINPRDVDLEQKKKDVLSLESLRKGFRKITNVRMNYADMETTYKYANSEGSEVEERDIITIFAPWVYAKDKAVIENYYKIIRGHEGYEIMDRAEDATKKTMDMAEKLLKAKYARAGRFPVIVDQKLGGVFVHEAVGHACEADIVLQDASVLKGKLNQRIGSEMLNVSDEGSIYVFGWTEVDDEGIKARNARLIENGVLTNYLQSRATASIMKMKPTGNGRCQSVGHRPIPRMTCTIIKCGDSDFDEMLSSIKDGYYLRGSRGGEVNPAKGEFIFNAQYGYRVKNGELKEMVKAVSLNGNITEILPKITMIGNDLEYDNGYCGKDEQIVPVSHGTPHFRIEEARVGGKE